MNRPSFNTTVSHLSTLCFLVAGLLSACSHPEPVAPVVVAPNRYELKAIRYFIGQGDRVDTTTIQLKGVSVYNAGSVAATQQVDEGFGGLMKTSRFTIDPASQLPAGLDLGTLAVSVPQHWYGNGLFDRSIDTYPLSAVQQQKPYGFDPNRLVTVKIPPKSKVDISRQITTYQLTCSFEGTVVNTATGQRYNLLGKWNGLLQYANPTTTLKESVL
ncbi:hypothetical protein ACAW74_19995 [Fibrella sp. WM1]|uniref:hypothetical protein n=1 Tax=Fibrella musci TaxID=3242485 RepID=UPI003520E6E3